MDIMHNLIRPAVKTSINRQLSGYLDHKYSTNCNVLDCNLQSSLENTNAQTNIYETNYFTSIIVLIVQ